MRRPRRGGNPTILCYDASDPSFWRIRRRASCRTRSPPLRERAKFLEIAGNKRFLLPPRPAFDLALGGDCINDPIEQLRKNQCDGTARCRVAVVMAGIMLADTFVEAGACRASIEAAIGTAQNVDPRAVGHVCVLILRDARSSG